MGRGRGILRRKRRKKLPVVPPNITRGLEVNARHLLSDADVIVVRVSVKDE